SPCREIIARHTVGLSDALTDAEIPPAEKVEDGLPKSLAACIQTYGLCHFKIKVSGQAAADADRLQRIAGIIQQFAPADFAFTLDGNEQFKSLESFREFWELTVGNESMKPFLQHIMFVEQPLHRDVALEPAVGDQLRNWHGHP